MIPSDIGTLMSIQMGDVVRHDLGDVRRQLAGLGILPGTEIHEFFEAYSVCSVRSEVSHEELMDPSHPSPQLESATAFARETYDVPERFICLTSGEGEGFFLYDLASNAIFDVGVDELDALEIGDVQPRWGSFFEFLRWYLGTP